MPVLEVTEHHPEDYRYRLATVITIIVGLGCFAPGAAIPISIAAPFASYFTWVLEGLRERDICKGRKGTDPKIQYRASAGEFLAPYMTAFAIVGGVGLMISHNHYIDRLDEGAMRAVLPVLNQACWEPHKTLPPITGSGGGDPTYYVTIDTIKNILPAGKQTVTSTTPSIPLSNDALYHIPSVKVSFTTNGFWFGKPYEYETSLPRPSARSGPWRPGQGLYSTGGGAPRVCVPTG